MLSMLFMNRRTDISCTELLLACQPIKTRVTKYRIPLKLDVNWKKLSMTKGRPISVEK